MALVSSAGSDDRLRMINAMAEHNRPKREGPLPHRRRQRGASALLAARHSLVVACCLVIGYAITRVVPTFSHNTAIDVIAIVAIWLCVTLPLWHWIDRDAEHHRVDLDQ